MHRRSFVSGAARGVIALIGIAVAPLAAAADARAERTAYLVKMAHFDADHPEDLFLERASLAVLSSSVRRMRRVQDTVGYGHFALLGLDAMIATARRYDALGPFPRAELDLVDRFYHFDATRYGFRGEKILDRIGDRIPARATAAVPGTGQHVFKGRSMVVLARARAAVGERLVLTSGVRGLAKQSYLFMRKALAVGGNLSRASRSLAPPGYSFHGVGDFDVGERGLGAANFSAAFAATEVHRRLVDLGYMRERCPLGNSLGMRYEPWHVQVV